jgi:glycerate kinase
MKFVIAPDSYKGCLKSVEVCRYLAAGIKQICPQAEIVTAPMADGGEGSVEAVVLSTKGEFRKYQVNGPLGKAVETSYGIAGKKNNTKTDSNSKTAIMEMASASGIELVTAEQLNPFKTSTFGTGQLLRHIIEEGIYDIIIGIGGSATVDGGAGMAQALGYKFLDQNGQVLTQPLGGGDLKKIVSIDNSEVLPELAQCRIRIASDVTNPLLGENGAAKVFGPQKGATPEMVTELEAGLKLYSDKIIAAGFAQNCATPGDGAAGGLGFALRTLCNAETVSGAELIINICGLKEKIRNADILITGEGCTDFQTAHGKLCSVIAQSAKEFEVPAVLVSGALRGDLSGLEPLFCAMFSVSAGPGDLNSALAQTPNNLIRMGRNIAGLKNE